MASQPMGFLDLPKDIRLIVYEYLPLEIRHAHICVSMVDERRQEKRFDDFDDEHIPLFADPKHRDNSVALLYRVPPINIRLTCKIINQEANALFQESKSYKRKIESYTTNNPPQIIDPFAFSTQFPALSMSVQSRFVSHIMRNLVFISWNVLMRHNGQQEEVDTAPASEYSSSMFLGSVPGKGHLQFLRHLSLYILKQFWAHKDVPDGVTVNSNVCILRVALRLGKDNPNKGVKWQDHLENFIEQSKTPVLSDAGLHMFSGKRSRISFQFVDPEVPEAGQLCDSDAINNARNRIKWDLDYAWRTYYASRKCYNWKPLVMRNETYTAEWRRGSLV